MASFLMERYARRWKAIGRTPSSGPLSRAWEGDDEVRCPGQLAPSNRRRSGSLHLARQRRYLTGVRPTRAPDTRISRVLQRAVRASRAQRSWCHARLLAEGACLRVLRFATCRGCKRQHRQRLATPPLRALCSARARAASSCSSGGLFRVHADPARADSLNPRPCLGPVLQCRCWSAGLASLLSSATH